MVLFHKAAKGIASCTIIHHNENVNHEKIMTESFDTVIFQSF